MARSSRPGWPALDAVVVTLTFVLLAGLVFPFAWVVLTSIRTEAEMFTRTFELAPKAVTFRKYRELFGSDFLRYLGNSTVVSAASTVVAVVTSLLAAYALSRYAFRGRSLVLGTFAFSQLFPFVVILTPLYILFWNLRLVNTLTGLVVAYVAITLPYCVYMLLGYFENVPVSLDEAARMDGCSTLRIIFRIVLPVAWPGIVATTVYAFIQAWNEYLFALTLMTESDKKTIPVGLAGFFGEYTTDWGAVMTASVIATAPTMIFFLVMQRQLVAGLAAGAVKQ
jgi:ABC-type glycerol-3-phosphate transport system permease component